MDVRERWQAFTCYCMSLTLSGKTARAVAPREITLSQGGEKRERRTLTLYIKVEVVGNYTYVHTQICALPGLMITGERLEISLRVSGWLPRRPRANF